MPDIYFIAQTPSIVYNIIFYDFVSYEATFYIFTNKKNISLYTRSPGMSIMMVVSRELPLSATPLCQLLPCHLEPPRSLAPCTSVIRVLCQALEPTAFLVHPVLAAAAEDAIAAHSSVTDGAWKLA